MNDLMPPGFWELVASKEREGQRNGQAVFNAAFYFYPRECRLLCGTSVDPFYVDAKVPFFLTELVEILTEETS